MGKGKRSPRPETATSYGTGAKSRKFTQMTEEHPDVLQNIEHALVDGYQTNDEVDDQLAWQALRTHMAARRSENGNVQPMVDALDRIRSIRVDLNETLWRRGLQAVDEAICGSSDLQEGTTDYLDDASSRL